MKFRIIALTLLAESLIPMRITERDHRLLKKINELPRRGNGWIAPRSGGYRPGGDFAKPPDPKTISRKPPPGDAGVARPR